MDQPVLNVLRIRPEPPASGTRFFERALAALDLHRQQPTADVLAVHDLSVGINAVVLGRLLTE